MGHLAGAWTDLARAAGATRLGVNRIQVENGRWSTPAHIESAGAPPHCHSAEDEFFIVLDGEGTLHVDPTPAKVEFGGKSEEHPVRRGSVASFAAGANLCHSLRAGDDGLTFLAYGTRQPHDVIYYLRRDALFFKGLGVMIPVEHVGFLAET